MQILGSTVGDHMYSFDTMSGEWNKVGAWAQPFRGRALYVPRHKLWFGLSDEDDWLCASNVAVPQPVL